MQVKMTAVKPHRVNSRNVAAGETYEVTRRDARTYKALGWSKPADAEAVAALGPVMKGGTYATRDMRAGGRAAKPAAAEDLNALTKDDLFGLAKTEGVDVGSRDSKADLVGKISKARTSKG